MPTKMPSSLRSRIADHALRKGWTIAETASKLDKFDKLITLVCKRTDRTVYIDKVTGFSRSGDLRRFKVAVHPAHYCDGAEALRGVTAAINQRTGKNVHSHSGYEGCPKRVEHNEPCAKAYHAADFEALISLIDRLYPGARLALSDRL